MSQIEKNKAELLEMMEQLAHEPLSPEHIRNLNTLRGAYKAVCMISGDGEAESEHIVSVFSEGGENYTPELDGDTEFEQVIMSIPMDKEHLKRVFCILNDHFTALSAVRSKPVESVIERLREVAAT